MSSSSFRVNIEDMNSTEVALKGIPAVYLDTSALVDISGGTLACEERVQQLDRFMIASAKENTALVSSTKAFEELRIFHDLRLKNQKSKPEIYNEVDDVIEFWLQNPSFALIEYKNDLALQSKIKEVALKHNLKWVDATHWVLASEEKGVEGFLSCDSDYLRINSNMWVFATSDAFRKYENSIVKLKAK